MLTHANVAVDLPNEIADCDDTQFELVIPLATGAMSDHAELVPVWRNRDAVQVDPDDVFDFDVQWIIRLTGLVFATQAQDTLNGPVGAACSGLFGVLLNAAAATAVEAGTALVAEMATAETTALAAVPAGSGDFLQATSDPSTANSPTAIWNFRMAISSDSTATFPIRAVPRATSKQFLAAANRRGNLSRIPRISAVVTCAAPNDTAMVGRCQPLPSDPKTARLAAARQLRMVRSDDDKASGQIVVSAEYSKTSQSPLRVFSKAAFTGPTGCATAPSDFMARSAGSHRPLRDQTP